jgi:uncharacterized Zn finger protein (UPF0148 family)
MSNTKTYDCPNCGQAQLRQTADGTLRCPNCGSEYAPPPTNVVDNIFERANLQKMDRFTQRAAGVADLKAKEEADSQLRMQKFWDEDRKRQEQLAAQLVERKRQEQQLMRITLIVLAVVGLALLIILIATAPR